MHPSMKLLATIFHPTGPPPLERYFRVLTRPKGDTRFAYRVGPTVICKKRVLTYVLTIRDDTHFSSSKQKLRPLPKQAGIGNPQ